MDLEDIPDENYDFVSIQCDCMHIMQARDGDSVAMPHGVGTGIVDGHCTKCGAEIKAHKVTMPRPFMTGNTPRLGRAQAPFPIEWIALTPEDIAQVHAALGFSGRNAPPSML